MEQGASQVFSSKDSTYQCRRQIQSLGLEDPLEKEMASHSSILAWKILWTEEPGGLQSIGSKRVRHDSACMQDGANIATQVFQQESTSPKSWVLEDPTGLMNIISFNSHKPTNEILFLSPLHR